jgi:hypothetical protein
VAPAVNRPFASIVPPPVTVQVNVGWVGKAVANWSRAVAPNCCVARGATEVLAGDTTMLVRV